VLAAPSHQKGKTVAQVALRWLVQKEIVAPIPRSSNPARLAENIAVFDFALGDEEMTRIDALKQPTGRIANPAGRVPPWDV
jgi:2,5-diketo-D-gluconate reductase B